jgi:hypothetical protein
MRFYFIEGLENGGDVLLSCGYAEWKNENN